MNSSWMQWALAIVLCVATSTVAGCGTQTESRDGVTSEQAVGSLHVPLVAPEQDRFRLRGALFDVTRRAGGAVLTVDSESDPDALSLDVDLLQGLYEMTLRDGWRLERLGDAGAAAEVSAALLTANPLPFEIQNGRVTELVYAFTTEQGIVSFGRGVASVSVSVTPAAPSAACSVLDGSSCPSGQTCLFGGASGRTYCAQPGSLPTGSACSSEQCVAGAQCLSLDPERPTERVCARFCNAESAFCGCQGLSIDPEVGVCAGAVPAGNVFSHEFGAGASELACGRWNAFRRGLASQAYDRVTLSGSRDGVFECSDPTRATQICQALRFGSFVDIPCQEHTWRVAECGGGAELSVDTSWCGCTSPGNTVRPCNGPNWGGVGTDTCSPIPQTIEVTCEPGVSQPPDPGACLDCARTNCPTQYANAIGSASDAVNRAVVRQLFDCVIGSDWELGGPIPQSSCFFSDPNQLLGSLLPCYCGSTPQDACISRGPRDSQEACGAEIEEASGCSPVIASCVTASGSDPSVPLGDALALLNCERAACGPECGFPHIDDE